ncbi:LysR substrate-binding domain-containing protein [Ewingella sp. S1.OA.A_B6]
MIETRVLKQFIVVAEVLNFHRAAEQLHMSQPPLSVAIRQLEEKLGVALFIRDRGGVTLTPAGEAFMYSAREVVKSLTEGIDHARNIAQGMAGKLTVSSVSLAAYPTLLSTFRRFRKAYPQVELVIKEMPSALQILALERGEIDLAFIRKPATIRSEMMMTPYLSEPLLAALPVDHPLANHSQIELSLLAKENFVFTPERLGEGYHHQLITFCKQAGFIPHIVQEAAQLSTLIALVSCGFGIALVPGSVAGYTLNDKVRFIEISSSGFAPRVELFHLHAVHQPRQNIPVILGNFLALLDVSVPEFE